MKYLLTQEELDNLIDLKAHNEAIRRSDDAFEWVFNKLKPEWCGKRYCDSCQLNTLRNDDSPTYDISHMICRKRRSYSK